MAQNLTEKIAQQFALGLPPDAEVRAGDYVTIKPAHVMTHDNSAAVISKFNALGATHVFDARQPVIALDHDIQNHSAENLAKYAAIEGFARRHSLAFFPAGRGIAHQVMVEEGFVLPGTFVVGADSHSNLYGALGALGTPVARTDAAAIWATGQFWWQVPQVVEVHLRGRLQPGVVGKDVIVALCGLFNADEVLNCCVEFTGPGAAGLTIEDRLTISNMTTEWGALSGVFACDEVTRAFLRDGSQAGAFHKAELPAADADARFAKRLTLDLAAVTPFVSGPNSVKDMTALPELAKQGIRIDKAYLMSCVNGRLGDFAAAAEVMRGRRVAPGVEFYIAAASAEVEQAARANGSWQTLLQAGAIELPPGCGACIGLGRGTLRAGETGISATNRNFQGRMGSREASVYLASPAVVAASAVAGRIAGPDSAADTSGIDALGALRRASSIRLEAEQPQPAAVEIIPGFPPAISGELLLVPADNLNTDGIYGKELTYREQVSPGEMAAAALANHDPAFASTARPGDILAAGFNFGCGSAREQAVTALMHLGIRMIIAGSFSQTYQRNALNNGFIVIECPPLVKWMQGARADQDARTIRTNLAATVDFVRSQVQVSSTSHPNYCTELPAGGFAFTPLGQVAQGLIVAGGLLPLLAQQLGTALAPNTASS